MTPTLAWALLLSPLVLGNELSEDSLPVCNCSQTRPQQDYYYDLDPMAMPEPECRPCFEGSTCVQEEERAVCQCAPYRFGTYCQYADLCHNGRSHCVSGDCHTSTKDNKAVCICNDDRGGEFCEFQRPSEEVLLLFEVSQPSGIQSLSEALSVLTRYAHLGGFQVADGGQAIYKHTNGICGRDKVDPNTEVIDLDMDNFEPYVVMIKAKLLMACGRLAEHHHTEIFTCFNSAYDAVHTLNSLRIYEETKRLGVHFIRAEMEHTLVECHHFVGIAVGVALLGLVLAALYLLYHRLSAGRVFRGSGAMGTGSGDTMNKLIEPNGYF